MNKLNVLHVTVGTQWGGIAAHLHNLLPAFLENQINVHFISLGKSLLSEKLLDKGISVKVFSRKCKLDPNALLQLLKEIKEKSIDIIHLHGYMAIIYGCTASLFCRKVKTVVTLHQPSQDFDKLSNIRFKYTLNTAYKLANFVNARFIAVSEHVMNTYSKKYSIDKRNIEIIHNGFDINSKELEFPQTIHKHKIGIPKDYSVVSIVGRLEKIKGHSFFIRAAKQVLQKHDKVIFLIIGEGSEKANLDFLVKELDIQENIKFLGFQKDIIGHLAITDILVMPSLFEGIPYALLEAMALGVNIIATNTGGLNKVIRDHMEGLLVTVGSPEEISQAILKLLQDNDLAQKLVKNATKRLVELFTADRMARATQSLYRKIQNS